MDEAKLKQLLEEAFSRQHADDLDKLTGLLRGSENEFDRMLEDSNTDISVALADIDTFKNINDTYGHDFGDEIIKEIAGIFTEIDASKEVYRYGGEEFLVFFEGMSKEEAFLIMEQARKSISGEACVKASATFSAGIATYPEDGTNWTEIKRKADGALYRAKTSGRNKICLAKEEKLVTKTAHYTVEQLKRLEKLAGERNMSEASLMREALDELLKKYNT
jgi:diguanylate cyclase (GGDEF)-like protein